MYSIAKLSPKERNLLFSKFALERGINISIVEKDFWVTLMLDYLFHKSSYRDFFIFKGGTSLSKCFNIINRFSEDIDLILKWNILTDDDPNKVRSKNQQDKYNKNINIKAQEFIRDKLKPEMVKDFRAILGLEPDIYIEEDEPQVLNFNYPRIRSNSMSGLLHSIRLEIGPLAALSPTKDVEISPMIARLQVPNLNIPSTIIKTVSPERTFWEKVLILNQEAHRSDEKDVPARYSRHYYDVYKISLTKYKEKAYKDIDLLNNIREFKKKFYPSSWAGYDLAKPGTFQLIPSKKHINELTKDYLSMQEMINDKTHINFKELLENIKSIEEEINNLK